MSNVHRIVFTQLLTRVNESGYQKYNQDHAQMLTKIELVSCLCIFVGKQGPKAYLQSICIEWGHICVHVNDVDGDSQNSNTQH